MRANYLFLLDSHLSLNFCHLSLNIKRMPKSSKPIKTNHEPGVKGVNKANNPKKIKTTPIVFLKIADIFRVIA